MTDSKNVFQEHRKEMVLQSIKSHHDQLLAEEEKRISLVRNGKSPETPVDHEQQARLDQAIQELNERWVSISEHGDAGLRDDRGLKPGNRLSLVASYNQGLATNAPSKSVLSKNPSVMQAEEEEPVWNPITSSFAYRETGFEPGPSSSERFPASPRDDRPELYSAKVSHNDEGQNAKYPDTHHGVQKGSTSNLEESQDLRSGLLNESQGSGSEKLVPISSGTSETGRFSYMKNIFESWITPTLKKFMFGGSSSIPPYRLISATVTGNRPRGEYVPRSVLPARGLGKQALHSTTTDLPDIDAKDRPKGVKVASKAEPETIGQFVTRVHDEALDQALVNSHIQPVSELRGSTIEKAPESCGSLNLGLSSNDFKPDPTAEGSQPHITQGATSGYVSNVTGSSTIPVSTTLSTERESSRSGVGEGEEVHEALHLELVLEHQRFLRDRELAERMANDETLALSTHEEARNQSSDQGDLMLAIDLAEGSVQDYTTFVREHSESQEAMQRIQTANNIHQERTSADRRAALELQALLDRTLEMAMPIYQEDRNYALRLQNESSQMEDDRRLAERLQLDVDERNISSIPTSDHIDRPEQSIAPLIRFQSDYWSDHELASRLQAESNISEGAEPYDSDAVNPPYWKSSLQTLSTRHDQNDWPENTRRLYAEKQNRVAWEEEKGRAAAQRLQDREAATARASLQTLSTRKDQSDWPENTRRLYAEKQNRVAWEEENRRVAAQRLQDREAATAREAQENIQRLQEAFGADDLRELQNTFAAEDRKEQADIQRLQDTLADEDRKAAAQAERVRRQENSNCVVCNDEFAKAAMFRVCKHEYCRGCLIGT